MKRRMMMEEGFFRVFLDFSESEDERVFVEYKGKEYREGTIRCKKGEIITCRAGADKIESGIYLNGEKVGAAVFGSVYELSVESSVQITAVSGKMYIITK